MNRGEILKSLNGFKTIKSRKLKIGEPRSNYHWLKKTCPKKLKISS